MKGIALSPQRAELKNPTQPDEHTHPMGITRLELSNFRNIVSGKLDPHPEGCNLIYGDNGSGKTSILEAIYYLSLGRSFRSSKYERIIHHEAQKFSIFAQTSANGSQVPVGIERHMDGEVKIRIAGKDVRSAADLAALMPVQLINSYCYSLLDAPAFRRKYLDWGVFYYSNEFLRIWRTFERALKQRNAALRGQLSLRELEAWTEELIQSAEKLHAARVEYIQQLLPLLSNAVGELLDLNQLEMSYQAGWNETRSYRDLLAESIDRDRVMGRTQIGPHRADFKVLIQGMPAKDILSRGQQKLFVCAMLLAQGMLLKENTNQGLIYLIDDLPAELDATSRFSLMSLLLKQDAQVFVTTVERESVDTFLVNAATKMFHVEHGRIRETDAVPA